MVRSAGLMQTLQRLSSTQSNSQGQGQGQGKSQGVVPPLRGDFSLNAANALGASALLIGGGLQRLTPTHDLNAGQQAALAGGPHACMTDSPPSSPAM